MKLLTGSFLQMIRKTIGLILIILLLVGLIPHVSITSKAVNPESFPYRVWFPDKNILVVSDQLMIWGVIAGSTSTNSYIKSRIGETLYTATARTTQCVCLVSQSINTFTLYYVDNEWHAELSDIVLSNYPTSGIVLYSSFWNNASLGSDFYANYDINNYTTTAEEWGMYNDAWNTSTYKVSNHFLGNTLPSDLPQGQDIESIINNLINSTTSTTTTANNLQNNIQTKYNQYENGTISANTLQNNIDSTISQLNTLTSNSGNTLADQVAINNAILYTQTVQDSLNKDLIIDELQNDLILSSSVSSAIRTNINNANNIFNQFKESDITQSEAINNINQYINNLNSLISSQSTTADINAINTAVNSISNIRDSISNYSDFNKEVSDKIQNSDQNEIDYLNQLMQETSPIQDMSAEKQFSTQQIQIGTNILSIIWDNEIIKRIVPIAGIFMIVCVVLGIKYKL